MPTSSGPLLQAFSIILALSSTLGLYFASGSSSWRTRLLLPANTVEALKQFGWKARGRFWQVGQESVDVTWLSKRGLLAELRNTWRRWLWSADTKSSAPLCFDEEPCHQQHVLLNEGGNPNFRTAVGNAADGRVLQRLGCRLACGCGEEVPSRTHLTFATAPRGPGFWNLAVSKNNGFLLRSSSSRPFCSFRRTRKRLSRCWL